MSLTDRGVVGGHRKFSVVVRNGGRLPVERVEVIAGNSPMDNVFEAPDDLVTRASVGTLFPESHQSHTFEWPDGLPETGQPDVDLTFVDTWGQRWIKNGALVAHGEPELPFPEITQDD